MDLHKFPLKSFDFTRFRGQGGWIFIDFLVFPFSSIFMDLFNLHRFSLILMVFHGFERFWGQNVGRPLPPCGDLKSPVPPVWITYISRFQILEAWIWRPGALMSGCWEDWNGLEEVTEVTAFWGEGIGRPSLTLVLQELGGFPN